MKKTALLGLVLTIGAGTFAAACGSDSKSNSGSGGQSNVGGSASVGGSGAVGGTNKGGGSSTTANPFCDGVDAGVERFDGGIIQVGGTDPVNSVALDVGGFYDQVKYKGYCFTYSDAKPDGSTIFPPCGGNGAECFTKDSKLCVTTSLGVASDVVWGSGIGCSLNEDQTTGKAGDPPSIAGITTLSVEVYGCKTPSSLRLQINVDPPIYEADIDKLHSGYYCGDVTLSAPDSNGARKGSIDIAKLREDCWTGTGLLLDPSKQTAKSIQLQVNSDSTKRTDYDFCVSKFALN
jgi:hypothetical protein